MSVISVNEISQGRRLQDDVEEDSGRREFIVIMDDVNDGPDVARTADDGNTAIPSLRDPHPNNSGILVARIDPQPTDSRLIWKVVVDYSGSPDIFIINPTDPTDAPWQISWGFENEEENIVKTRTTTGSGTWDTNAGEPIDNSLGKPFADPLRENKARLVCTLVKNKSSFNVSQAVDYMNTMNDAPVTIAGYTAAKWEAKLTEYSGQKTWQGDTFYWVVQYRVLFDRDTFIRELMNTGWKKLVGGKEQDITSDGDGSGAIEPARLDANSAVTDTAYYWRFGTLLAKNFSSLGLPTTM